MILEFTARNLNVYFKYYLIVWVVSPRGVVANVLDCEIVVSKFERQSHYYVHFRTYTHGEGMESLG